ncbi:glycoside hydrolase family 28 protein [Alteromonas stellipolaris]|uniref:glycoside hydrolase family 28 protein n=1 Tax=Alteromonas stellipolaris TaxID=233316 RepID=UPI003565CCCE
MTLNKHRRHLLKAGLAATLSPVIPFSAGCSMSATSTPSSTTRSQAQWDKEAQLIRNRVARPTFANNTVFIEQFGALPNALDSDSLPALNAAIAHLVSIGGGKVVVPKGEFFCKGPIHLKSNINLHIEEGATLHFSTDSQHYKPYVHTRWEGMELMGYSPLIYAFKQKNIAITGQGTLDGGASADNWWPWKGKWKTSEWGDHAVENQKYTRDTLQVMVEDGTPVSERVFEENYLRPPFIQPYLCENVLIEGVTILRSPFWLVNPVLCKNVTVSNIHCQSFGPNSDGCDPESCTDVLIQSCVFDTGDDCIAIKSGRNADGRRLNQPSENIIIEDCEMKAGHGGIVIGSEISGGVRNLYAQRCVMSSPNLDRGIRIKTNSIRGGHLKNLNYRHISIGDVKDAIVVNFFYEEGDAGNFPPKLEGITVEHMTVKRADRAFMLRGYDHTPITGLSLHDISIASVEKPSVIENVEAIQTSNIVIAGKKVGLRDA